MKNNNSKEVERLQIEGFLKKKGTDRVEFLLKSEKDSPYRRKFIRNMIAMVILSILCISSAGYLLIYMNQAAVEGFGTVEKISVVVIALFFHVVLLADLILLFYSVNILKMNVLDKIAQKEKPVI